METAFNMFFFYYDFDVNHLVVVFKWYLRTLCVCVLGQSLMFGFICLIQLNTFIVMLIVVNYAREFDVI